MSAYRREIVEARRINWILAARDPEYQRSMIEYQRSLIEYHPKREKFRRA